LLFHGLIFQNPRCDAHVRSKRAKGTSMKKTVAEMDIAGRAVLVRADLDVPMRNGRVVDDASLVDAAEGLLKLAQAGAKTVIAAHLDAPQGEVVEEWRLDPIAQRLSDILEREIIKADDCIGEEIGETVEHMLPGELLLLENTRFYVGETANDDAFAAALTRPVTLFVNDAFSLLHCVWASTVGVAAHVEAVAGPLLARDLERLAPLREPDAPPPLALIGGLCDRRKLGAVEHLARNGSVVLLGGVVANTFLKASGAKVYASAVDEEACAEAARILRDYKERIVLPIDALVVDKPGRGAQRKMFAIDAIPEGWSIVDIGPESIDVFQEHLEAAQNVVWAGPVGVAEVAAYSEGTCAISHILAEADMPAVIGGAATLAAIRRAGEAEGLADCLIRGGCALLLYLQAAELPALSVLQEV
jgi:phosphoglycerate kinase